MGDRSGKSRAEREEHESCLSLGVTPHQAIIVPPLVLGAVRYANLCSSNISEVNPLCLQDKPTVKLLMKQALVNIKKTEKFV